MAYIGNQPTVGNFVKLDAITTSATATYNLLNGGVAYSPQSANHCIVSLNGVIQEPTSSGNVGGFTISGSTIVFTSALTSADVIDFILVLGDVLNIGTPSDATVTTAKLASSLDFSSKTITLASNMKNTPAFEAHLSASQTGITDATYTKVNNNTEIFDTDSAYDNATNYRFTPQVAGKYFVYGGINVSGSANDAIINCQIAIYKNGSAYKTLDQNAGNAAANFHAMTTYNYAIIDMNGTTDYLELFGRVDVSSGTVNFYFNNSVKSAFFGAYRLIGI